MDQEMQVNFMINPDLVGDGKGLHYGKKKDCFFFHFYFWER